MRQLLDAGRGLTNNDQSVRSRITTKSGYLLRIAASKAVGLESMADPRLKRDDENSEFVQRASSLMRSFTEGKVRRIYDRAQGASVRHFTSAENVF